MLIQEVSTSTTNPQGSFTTADRRTPIYSEAEEDRLFRLYQRREELAVVRDILLLELEIKELKNQKTNGYTNTEEG